MEIRHQKPDLLRAIGPDGQILSADQIFIVDIRTRKETAGDGGAEYCAQIADAVRTILDDGFTGAEVLRSRGW